MAGDNHCMYFVKRKKRFCRMTVREGKRYCGEHQRDTANFNDAEIIDKRVECPLDPKQ
jgi:tRNA:m4X modification enzyme